MKWFLGQKWNEVHLRQLLSPCRFSIYSTVSDGTVLARGYIYDVWGPCCPCSLRRSWLRRQTRFLSIRCSLATALTPLPPHNSALTRAARWSAASFLSSGVSVLLRLFLRGPGTSATAATSALSLPRESKAADLDTQLVRGRR